MKRINHPWQVATIVASGLVVILACVLGYTRLGSAQTIAIQGEATIPETFDTFTFTPLFQNKSADGQAAASNTAISHLRQMGVKASDIKTAANPGTAQEPSSTSVTVTTHDAKLADQIAAYLPSAGAMGQLTVQKSASAELLRRLDAQARRDAVRDAQLKATVVARGLHAKVGRAVKVDETSAPVITNSASTSHLGAYQLNVIFQLN